MLDTYAAATRSMHLSGEEISQVLDMDQEILEALLLELSLILCNGLQVRSHYLVHLVQGIVGLVLTPYTLIIICLIGEQHQHQPC